MANLKHCATERSQTQKTTQYMKSLIRNFWMRLSERQKAYQWLLRAGKWNEWLTTKWLPFGGDENVPELLNSGNLLKITELHTHEGWMLQYVNYASLTLLKQIINSEYCLQYFRPYCDFMLYTSPLIFIQFFHLPT